MFMFVAKLNSIFMYMWKMLRSYVVHSSLSETFAGKKKKNYFISIFICFLFLIIIYIYIYLFIYYYVKIVRAKPVIPH